MVITLFFISLLEAVLIAYLLKEIQYQKKGIKLFNDGLNKFAQLFSEEVKRTDSIKDKIAIQEIEIQALTREYEILKAENEEISKNILEDSEKINDLTNHLKAITTAMEQLNVQSNIVQHDAINELNKQFNLFEEWLYGKTSE